MTKKYLCFVLIAILALMPLSIASVKATNEGSYRLGYMKAYLTLDPQNSPGANWYPELKNDTCSLSKSYISDNKIMPAVTNTTSCLDGFFQGWRDWCSSNAKHAVGCIGNLTLGDFPDTLLKAHQQYIAGQKAANNIYSTICPVGENAAFCLGWANNNTFDDEGCADEPAANITTGLVGCIGDTLTESQIGGLPTLVGNWHFVNETKANNKPSITGTFLFNNDGYMRMTVPNKSGLGDYVKEESWGYLGHRILTFCNTDGDCQNSTLTMIMPNHMEFVDSNYNTVHLMRYSPSPPTPLPTVAAAQHHITPTTPHYIITNPKQTNNMTTLYQSGRFQADMGNNTGAIAIYKKALGIDPNNEKVLADMGRVLFGLKNYTGAMSVLNKAIDLNSTDANTLELKGIVLYELGHFREAVVSLDKALELEPSYSSYYALENKGLALYKLGDYTDALSTLDKALRLNSGDTTAIYNKALVLATLGLSTHDVGDLNAALDNLNKALRINPNYGDAWSIQTLLTQLLMPLSPSPSQTGR